MKLDGAVPVIGVVAPLVGAVALMLSVSACWPSEVQSSGEISSAATATSPSLDLAPMIAAEVLDGAAEGDRVRVRDGLTTEPDSWLGAAVDGNIYVSGEWMESDPPQAGGAIIVVSVVPVKTLGLSRWRQLLRGSTWSS
jgi:hypothetical protein